MAENQLQMIGAKCGYLQVSPPPDSYSLINIDGSSASVGKEVHFIKTGDYDEDQVKNRVMSYATHNPAFEWRHIAIQNYRKDLSNPGDKCKIGTKLQKSVLSKPNFEPVEDRREWFRTINRRTQLEKLLEALDNVDVAQEEYRGILWKMILDGFWGEMKAQNFLMNAVEGLDRQQWIVVCQWFETLVNLLGQIKEESERPESENPDIIKQFPWTIQRVEALVQACMSVIYPTQPQNFIHTLQTFADPTQLQYPNDTLRNFADPTQPQYFNNVLPNFVEIMKEDPLKPLLLATDELRLTRLSQLEQGLSDSMQRLNDIKGRYDINVIWIYDNVNILVAANSEDQLAFLNESVAILFFDYILNGRE